MFRRRNGPCLFDNDCPTWCCIHIIACARFCTNCHCTTLTALHYTNSCTLAHLHTTHLHYTNSVVLSPCVSRRHLRHCHILDSDVRKMGVVHLRTFWGLPAQMTENVSVAYLGMMPYSWWFLWRPAALWRGALVA